MYLHLYTSAKQNNSPPQKNPMLHLSEHASISLFFQLFLRVWLPCYDGTWNCELKISPFSHKLLLARVFLSQKREMNLERSTSLQCWGPLHGLVWVEPGQIHEVHSHSSLCGDINWKRLEETKTNHVSKRWKENKVGCVF